MGLTIGGPKAWKVKRHGDVVVAFHWVNGEPAMCLFPFIRRLGSAVFIIPMELAHVYAKSDGYPTKELIEKATLAANVMAMDASSRAVVFNIATAMLDSIDDLLDMPPKPTGLTQAQTRAAGEATLFIGGQKISAGEAAPDEEPDFVPVSAQH